MKSKYEENEEWRYYQLHREPEFDSGRLDLFIAIGFIFAPVIALAILAANICNFVSEKRGKRNA